MKRVVVCCALVAVTASAFASFWLAWDGWRILAAELPLPLAASFMPHGHSRTEASALADSAGPVAREEMAAMRDGVRLYTRAVVPADGKFPCVFERTPYPRGDELKKPYPAQTAAHDRFATRGYVHVVQHCRGFGRSEGLCRLYDERNDGLDTLAWIRRQPWYNGEIFLVGGSYTATVHLMYLSDEPPDVKGACLSIQTDRMYGRNYRNGCNYGWCNIGWIHSMMKREHPDARPVSEACRRPYRDIARRMFGQDDPQVTGFLMHTEEDSFWTSDPRHDVMAHIRFPVLWKDGLYDFYIEGMTSMWERMLPEWKARSVFVLQPRGHGNNALEKTPIPCTKPGDALSDVDFFDSIRGQSRTAFPCGQVFYHSIGADTWRTNRWPRTATSRRLTFPCEGREWTYDPKGPRIPNMSEGMSQRVWEPGSRTDATEFVSPPFAAEASFFGRPRLQASVKSDCGDTQFFFRIDLVAPDGSAWNVCQTITSLRHAKRDYRPGETVALNLDFPLTAFTVKPGWRVRMDVASDGGVYVQHANVAKHWAEVTEDDVRIAHNALVAREVTLDLPEE